MGATVRAAPSALNSGCHLRQRLTADSFCLCCEPRGQLCFAQTWEAVDAHNYPKVKLLMRKVRYLYLTLTKSSIQKMYLDDVTNIHMSTE